MIPETRGNSQKYDFETMKNESFIVVESYNKAGSIRSAAYQRGYKIAVRTIGGEIRVYFLGKR